MLAYLGQAGPYCTITSSNINAITAGSRVVYLQAAGATSLDSDIVLVVGPGNYALGHVVLDFTTGIGTVTFWGGTGHFRSRPREGRRLSHRRGQLGLGRQVLPRPDTEGPPPKRHLVETAAR